MPVVSQGRTGRFTEHRQSDGQRDSFEPQRGVLRALSHIRSLIGIGGHLAVPPLPHHRAYFTYHGGSIELSRDRNIKSRKAD